MSKQNERRRVILKLFECFSSITHRFITQAIIILIIIIKILTIIIMIIIIILIII